MTVVRELIDALVERGVDPVDAAEIITRAAIHGASERQEPKTSRQLRNQRYYEKRASEKRLKSSEKRLNKTDSDDLDADNVLSLDKKAPPIPPEKTNPNLVPPSPPKGGSSPTDRAFDAFCSAVSGTSIPIPRKLTADRRRKLDARLREHGEDVWREACQRVVQSPFCLGENDRGWRADLDFLLQPKSLNRLMEGSYDRPAPRATSPPEKQTAMQAYDEIARERGWTENEPKRLPGNNSDAERLSAERGEREGVVVDLRKSADGSFGSGGQ